MRSCQFENVFNALQTIRERLENEATTWSDLSPYERQYARKLIGLMEECNEMFPDWLEMPGEEDEDVA